MSGNPPKPLWLGIHIAKLSQKVLGQWMINDVDGHAWSLQFLSKLNSLRLTNSFKLRLKSECKNSSTG